MHPCNTRNIIKRAFRYWEEVTELTFTESDEEETDIDIKFGYSK